MATSGDEHGPAIEQPIGGNPLLAPLGNYGGPTRPSPLLPGSPAIGAGNTSPRRQRPRATPLTTNRAARGFARTLNGMVNIGGISRTRSVAPLQAHKTPIQGVSGSFNLG